MGDYIVMGIVGILVLVMSVLPKTVYNGITYTFSMHKYGIRKIQRYRTTTDSIANLIIGILVVFSIFYCFIPFYSVVYAILFILSYLCLLAQVNRVISVQQLPVLSPIPCAALPSEAPDLLPQ